MAITNVSICNMALISLGQTTITALTDENENARRCNAIYEQVRNDLMVKHPWNFCIKRADLVSIVEFNNVYYKCLIANTSTDFATDLAALKWETNTDWVTATSYAVGDQVYYSGVHYTCVTPHTSGVWATDLAAVKWVVSVEPEFDLQYAYRLPTDLLRVFSVYGDEPHKIEGGYLYANASAISVRYIALITDPTKYDTAFVTALVTQLAAALALAVTNNRNITADMKAEAKEKKYEALGTDSQGSGTPDEPRADEWINAR
jgi:hypothetical protein